MLVGSLALTSCGGEPASNNLPPEATQGDYIGHDDLDTTGTTTDTTQTDTLPTGQ